MKKNILKSILLCGLTFLFNNFLNAEYSISFIENHTNAPIRVEFIKNNEPNGEPIVVAPMTKIPLNNPIMPKVLANTLTKIKDSKTNEERITLINYIQSGGRKNPNRLENCDCNINVNNYIKISGINSPNFNFVATFLSDNESFLLWQEKGKLFIPQYIFNHGGSDL